MNDLDIRAILKEELMRRHVKDKDTLVLDELGVRHGTARIDLVGCPQSSAHSLIN